MNFKQILERAIELKGSGREVANWLGIAEQQITDAKSGRAGLKDKACLQLAQLLGMDFGKVIAARNEWTAKSDEERSFWHPLANAAGICAISLTFVTSFMSPSPAQAAPAQGLEVSNFVYYVKRWIKNRLRRRGKGGIVFGNCLAACGNYYSWGCTTP